MNSVLLLRRIAVGLLLAALPAMCQIARPVRGTRSAKATPDAISNQPLATFDGTVHAIDKKAILLEQEDSNTLRLVCSRKTHYYDGSQEIKASAIKLGDHISVETRELRDAEIEAVNVRLQKAKSQ